MADNRVTLKGLVKALVGAVASAQDAIEYQQVRKIQAYQDDTMRPKTIRMLLPSMRPDARPGEEDLYRIPLLSLIPFSALKIDEAVLDFTVSLGDVGNLKQEQERNLDNEIQIDHRAGNSGSGNTIRLSVKLKSLEPTDGTMKFMGQIVQTQGIYATAPSKENAKPADREPREELNL